MELRRDLLVGVGSLLALNLLIAVATIGVLTRMGPVIDRILRENIYSTRAGEEMLAILASSADQPMGPPERQRYRGALDRAQSNVTESQEQAPLSRLRALGEAVAEGNRSARLESVDLILKITEVNYKAMHDLDTEARRLGLAGAWFSVFVASFALILSVSAVQRLTQRLIVPVRELLAALEAARSGDVFRRCVASSPPTEFRRIFAQVNEMLDMRSNPRPYTERRAQVDRAVVMWALRQRHHATFVVDERGQIFAANGPGHALLGDPRAPMVRAALAGDRGQARPLPAGLQLSVEALPDGGVWVCEVHEVSEAPST